MAADLQTPSHGGLAAQAPAVIDAAPGLVVVDEAYGQFADWSAMTLLDEESPLVVTRTFSKTWSMAGARLGYLLALIGTRVLSRSPIVHVDGPRSVRAAFTVFEALQLAEHAGLHGATIGWRWPFRFLMEWRRQP